MFKPVLGLCPPPLILQIYKWGEEFNFGYFTNFCFPRSSPFPDLMSQGLTSCPCPSVPALRFPQDAGELLELFKLANALFK